MALSIFMPSTTGMEAYSAAIETVSTNIANIATTGYKSSETMFYSLLGSQPVVKNNNSGLSSSRADINGVGYYNRNLIDQQGVVRSTGNSFDVAINGTGNAFFMVNNEGKTLYTRAGDFGTRTIDGHTYLIASNGARVQGFAAIPGGGFSGNPSDIEVVSPEKLPSTPTTEMEVTANVSTDNEDNNYGLTVYGPNNDGRTLSMKFSKVEGKENTWDVSFALEDGTVVSQPIEAVFDGKGQLITPKNIDMTLNWDDGSSQNLNLDISKMTQFAGSNNLDNVSQNGNPSGNLEKTYIDEGGIVRSKYSNGQTYDIAKLAIVGFTSPNNLVPVSNTQFEAYADAGVSTYLSDDGIVEPGALENSTATVEGEFSRMVVVQRAYSLNGSAFTTSDEMLQELVNLKT